MIIEIDPNQKDHILSLSKTLNIYDIKFYKDLNKLTRVVQIEKN